MEGNDDDHDDRSGADATDGPRTIGDWTAYYAAESEVDGEVGGGASGADARAGIYYYHNATTGESTWDPPPGFEDDGGDIDDGVGANAESSSSSSSSSSSAKRSLDDFHRSSAVDDDDDDGNENGRDENDGIADGEDVGGGWVAYMDDDGRYYYYRAETGETQWDRPGGDGMMVNDDDDDDDEDYDGRDSNVGTTRGAIDDDRDGAFDRRSDDGREYNANEIDDEDARVEVAAAATKEEDEEDAAAIAERLLRRPDAVMEADVLDSIEVLVRHSGPEVAVPLAMQSLLDGYNGDAAMCGLLGSWLARLKSATMAAADGGCAGGRRGPTDNDDDDDDDDDDDVCDDRDPMLRDGASDAARVVVEGVIDKLAKERFTKDHGDAILSLDKNKAAFIDRMIRSDRWRRLLIDLSATNKESMLFMICLRKISNLGHHRDIANRINPSEFFGVFDSMLQSELSIVGCAAVDGYAEDVVDAMDASLGPMGTLISDLRRNCTSTSYTYLYAMEVIRALLTKSNEWLTSYDDDQSERHARRPMMLRRAIRKWERLRDELEDEMLHPPNTGTTFQRKRRIDVALITSDLFQRKRHRVDPRSRNERVDNEGIGILTTGDLENTLDSSLIQLLTKNSLGNPIDRDVLDNVLKYAYGGSTDRIGDLLIRHPTAVTALLNNLFDPKRRIRQLETRLKCARLVALAVTASERAARSSTYDRVELIESDEGVLSEVILKGSQLCEQLENMVSFTVIDEVDENAGGSIGRQLSAMCIRHSVISRGFLIWAREHASGADFVATASYPTLSPCILCLVKLICRHHPLARPTALDVSLLFLGHSNREISHQKMQSIKEQCVRLMLWLSSQGLSLVVISAVQGKLEKGGSSSSDMDSALVRYFLVGMIDIVSPPFSLAFVRALGGLLLRGSCVDAIQSKLFDATKRERIAQLVGQFEDQEVQKRDKMLLSKLKHIYCRDAHD
jgi:hypothetical protein